MQAARYALCLSVLLLLSHAAHAAPLKVLIRYDDYSAFSDTQVERSLFAGVGSLGGGVLVGIIPFPYAPYPIAGSGATHPRPNLNPEKLQLLASHAASGVVELAVHGYSHRNNAQSGLRSEFSVLPEDMQSRLLAASRDALEKVLNFPVRTFIPPFNAYDDGTLRALEQSGYVLLSAGTSGAVQVAGTLSYLPGGTYPQSAKALIAEALSKGHSDALFIPVLHAYDFAESGGGMSSFRVGSPKMSLVSFLDELRSLAQSGQVRFVSLRGLREGGEDLSAERLLTNRALRTSVVVRHRLLPEAWNLYPVEGLYYSKSGARWLRIRQVLALGCIYASALILVAVAAWHLARRPSRHPRLYSGIAAAITVAASAVLVWRAMSGWLYMSSAVALTCCVGLLVGLAVSQFRSAAHG